MYFALPSFWISWMVCKKIWSYLKRFAFFSKSRQNFPVFVFCKMHLKDQMLFCDIESTRKVSIFLITSMYLCSFKKKITFTSRKIVTFLHNKSEFCSLFCYYIQVYSTKYYFFSHSQFTNYGIFQCSQWTIGS